MNNKCHHRHQDGSKTNSKNKSEATIGATCLRMVTAVPLAREGYPFIFIGLGLGYLSALAGWSYLAVFWLLISGFCGWFFRDPERHSPADPAAV
ncbi:MAG: hypothetical protein HQK60_09725, partial [Deltaproteobacteria bacterium]|nr:hypothetical protein [Deltaproteobacteria bacterium]